MYGEFWKILTKININCSIFGRLRGKFFDLFQQHKARLLIGRREIMKVIKSLFFTVLFLLTTTMVSAASVSGQGTWETTLEARDLDGNMSTIEAYYDTVLDITWLADASTNGLMNWSDANAWASSLTIGSYTDWRLPNTVDTGNDGCNWSYTGTDCGYNVDTSTGEMASMFYDTLGNLAYYDTTGTGPQSGWGLTNTGLFSNLQDGFYWSSTEYVTDTSKAWEFGFGFGSQYRDTKTDADDYVLVVHDGDVGTAVVPVPSAVWLFGSGLLGLVGVARRSTQQS